MLERCEGFAVYTSRKQVGVVEEIRLSPDGTRPAALAVRAGVLGSWRLLVPVDEVAEVWAEERRIVLRPGGLLAVP